MSLHEVGRLVLLGGLALVVVGLLLLVGGALGLGRLPGDLRLERGNLRVYVPIATSVLVSLVLTVLVNLLARR